MTGKQDLKGNSYGHSVESRPSLQSAAPIEEDVRATKPTSIPKQDFGPKESIPPLSDSSSYSSTEQASDGSAQAIFHIPDKSRSIDWNRTIEHVI